MKYIRIFMVFALFYSAECKNNAKALTESMGQEIIEIGSPIKELPPGLEEEPTADEGTAAPPPTPPPARRPGKATTTKTKEDSEAEDTASQEEEARIEKELEEIYKDTDYKADSSETMNDLKANVTAAEKPIARAKSSGSFSFQPEGKSQAAIERFRTSVDEINCARRVTQRLRAEEGGESKAAVREFCLSSAQLATLALTLLVCY